MALENKREFFAWNKSIPNYSEFQHAILEGVTKNPKRKLKILELGIGAGGTMVLFLEKFPKCKYFGIDKSRSVVEKCRDAFKHYPNVKIEIADFSKFEIEEKFDVVIAALSLHHLEKEAKQKLLNKIKNWLRRDGIFIFGDIVKLNDKKMDEKAVKIFQIFQEKFLNKEEIQELKRHRQNNKHIFNTIEEMENMLKEAGFVKIDVIWSYYRLAVIRATLR
jgi:tRNA (cmo5U34)-methyltransferase